MVIENRIWLYLLFSAASLVFLWYLAGKLRHDLHMLQQNSYRNERYRRWFREHRRQERSIAAWLLFVLILACFLSPLWLPISMDFSQLLFCFCFFLVCLALGVKQWRRPPAKKPLVMTARAWRLWITALALALLWLVCALILLSKLMLRPLPAYTGMALLLLLVALPTSSGDYLLIVNSLLKPLEQGINNRYLKQARRILAQRPELKRVAITGSYGKTSVKMILAAMLGEKYLTLATPDSVNTPMGITRVIREQLKPIHEVFICEMGAKQPNDIAELCQLVQPQTGVLTAIGSQHLETFGSEEAIAQTKFELVRALPPNGLAVLNLDQKAIAAKARLAPCAVIGYGLNQQQPYHAEDIRYNAEGLSFTLVTPQGESQEFSSRLLGRHNVANLVGAAAAAHALGLPLAAAARAARTLAPLPHRLQLLPGPGYTIIDDAFNSNPEGAAAALEVLSQMPGEQKILITPGMVELGGAQQQLNRALARQAARVCDYIILVGKKHSKPLQEGLAEAKYPPAQYAVAANLAEARKILSSIIRPGAAVLFENDLPDTYDEAKS